METSQAGGLAITQLCLAPNAPFRGFILGISADSIADDITPLER
jgi:hypothetical protein